MNLILLGPTSFPHGFEAEIQRLRILTKNLVKVGLGVTVLNRFGTNSKYFLENTSIKKEGWYEGVKFLFMSGNPFRDNNFFVRNFNKIKGSFWEIVFLMKHRNKSTFFLVSSLRSFLIIRYIIVSKMLRYKIILQLVEFNSGQYLKKNILVKLNDILFERYVLKYVDGIIPISHYLMEYLESKGLKEKLIHIPLLSDMERFANYTKETKTLYFLYCGSQGFEKDIYFILESYKKLNTNIFKLYLIINGSSEFLDEIKHRIRDLQIQENVIVFTSVTDNELNKLYINAYSLLIPLSNSLRDKSRFPHKISEYVCTGNPIITTNKGEIVHYFKNCETAIIAEEYEIDKFSEMMRFAISNPDEAKRIGKNARELADSKFCPIEHAANLKIYLEEFELRRSK
jgi:glycosyltransferase involved in cell wall biosynthesis